MFKTIKMLILGVILMFAVTTGLSGCSTVNSALSNPNTAQVAEATLLAASSMVFEKNPQLKPQVKSIATQALTILQCTNSCAPITKAGAVSWLNSQMTASGKVDPNIKTLVDTLVLLYMPDWSSSTLNFLSATDKSELMEVCNILIAAASN